MESKTSRPVVLWAKERTERDVQSVRELKKRLRGDKVLGYVRLVGF
jgi:hypothetical protein